MTQQDIKWLVDVTMGYFRALDGNTSELAIARERFEHGVVALCRREYRRGYEDGKRTARREIDADQTG